MPIELSRPEFRQKSIADRGAQLADNKPNSGNWDMPTVNETGGETDTVWISPEYGALISVVASSALCRRY